MPAPVNVKLRSPTISVPDWTQEAAEWTSLNAQAGGNRDFFPLTIKAAYVIGIAHDLCETVSHMLLHPNARAITYIPAYGVFASAVELLGRCINGNSGARNNTQDLKTGFKWLASSSYQSISDDYILVTTGGDAYSINMLAALRHFAAHGQATSKKSVAGTYLFGNIDYEILSGMPPRIADGIERYWNELQHSDDLCNRLAQANVIALRNWPVLQSWTRFERDEAGQYHTITEIFNRFKWQA